MSSNDLFMSQMEENVRYNLIFPYHINFDELQGRYTYNKDCVDLFHTHNFEQLLRVVYNEPKAFYLTDDDKIYYSKQELEFIERVKECECKKLDLGYSMVTLDLTDETIAYLNNLKMDLDMTFEEVVNYVLRELIKEDGKVLKDLLSSK